MELEALPRQIARTQRFTLGVPRNFALSPDGERVIFLRTRGGEDRVSCVWLLENGQERLLLDPDDFDSVASISDEERVRRERAREHATGIVTFSTDESLQTIAFEVDGKVWISGVDGAAPRLVPTHANPFDPRIDPTGKRIAYVAAGVLCVVDIATGLDSELSTPEGPDISYGLAEHVAAEEMHRLRGFWWSPNGERLLVARVDNTSVQQWWISDSANPHIQPRAVRYPAAGTTNADVSLWVLGLRGERIEVRWDRAAFEYLVTVAWDLHGPLLSVQSRDQRTVRILSVDPSTGVTTVLHEERETPWVHMTIGAPVRTASGSLVRVADVKGTRRLVVNDESVTADGVHVREVLSIDGEKVLFTASKEPTEVHVWSYDPEQGPIQVTKEPGDHRGTSNGGLFVLSSHTEGGRSVRVSRKGVDDVAIRSLDAEPVLIPRITWLSLGDREIRTALMLPTWYEPGVTTLPILMNPYGGPSLQLVTRARHFWFCEAQWFAECGFAVVIADGSGTPGRGPDWEHEVYGDSLSSVLVDQVTALQGVAQLYPDLDVERVGIRGWSYGGTLATAAVLRHPEVFHAAISGAAPSDQRLYDTYFKERYLGHPDLVPENYFRSSPINEAASLRRPLLLIHGMADDNVVVAHTLRMSTELLQAGRFHQVLPLSGSGHSPTDEMTIFNLLMYQSRFLQQSLGVEPR
ncbi:MAG: S9 family peptidase [Acidimicrobiales bacterium]